MSSSRIAFNKVSVGSVTVTGAEFVSGSGNLSIRGNDKSIATADGNIHYFRVSRTPEVSFQAFGNKSELSSSVGEAVPVSVYRDDALIYQFEGIVTVAYSADPGLTSVSISGNPEL